MTQNSINTRAPEGKTPIQAGENWWGALDFQHALETNASDYLMPDMMKAAALQVHRDTLRA